MGIWRLEAISQDISAASSFGKQDRDKSDMGISHFGRRSSSAFLYSITASLVPALQKKGTNDIGGLNHLQLVD